MRSWTVLPTCLFVLTFGAFGADAGQNPTPQTIEIAQADEASPAAAKDLPKGIELKPGAAKAAADQSADPKTRQIVTEGKGGEDADDADDDAQAADTKDEDADDKADTAKKADEPDDGDDAKAADDDSEAADSDADDADDKTDTAKKAEEPDDGDGPEAAAADEADEDENLALAVQTELKRVGCYASSLDGVWGHRSQQALAAFGHFAHAKIGDLSPTADVLAIIKDKDGVVCIAEAEEPGPAPRRHRKHGYGGGGYDGGYGGGGYDGGGYGGGGYDGGGYGGGGGY